MTSITVGLLSPSIIFVGETLLDFTFVQFRFSEIDQTWYFCSCRLLSQRTKVQQKHDDFDETVGLHVSLFITGVGEVRISYPKQRRIQDFPEGLGQPQSGMCQPFIWQNVCQKLHENERNCTGMGANAKRLKYQEGNNHKVTILNSDWQSERMPILSIPYIRKNKLLNFEY